MDQEILLDNSTEAMPSSVSEKMIPQSKVDQIVKTTKLETAKRAREEALAELGGMQSQQSPASSAMTPQMMEEGVMSVLQRLSDKAAEDQRAEEERQQIQEVNRIASEFNNKLAHAASKYEDFADTVGDVQFTAIPHVVMLANEFDNSGDIMYELAKNPQKLVQINAQAITAPKSAKKEMEKLSQSISLNEQAKQVKLPNPPLNKIPSSPSTVDDGSNRSVSDWRKINIKR